MKTQMNIKNGFIAIVVAVLMTCAGFPTYAQDDDYVEGGQNWDLLIGGGGIMMPAYLGSDELEFEPTPFIDASLRTRYAEFFLNIEEGAGLSLEFSDSLPVTFLTGVNLGDGRDHEDMKFLEGTPDIENSYVVFGAVEIDLEAAGEFSATVTYAPTTMNYKEAARKDSDYDGLLVSLDWENGLGFNRFMLGFEAGLTWMNADYAEANYSLAYPTARLTQTFEANSGIQDVHASVQVIYGLTERLALGLVGEGTYLLGDAADSPFTKQEFQPFGGIFMAYRF